VGGDGGGELRWSPIAALGATDARPDVADLVVAELVVAEHEAVQLGTGGTGAAPARHRRHRRGAAVAAASSHTQLGPGATGPALPG
jgi:hypothetical protein